MPREPVKMLLSLGRVPSSDSAEAEIHAFEKQLEALDTPVTKEEAELLVSALPLDEDDCYGLAWSLLHKIETAHAAFDSAFQTRLSPSRYREGLLLQRIQNKRA